LFTPRRAINHPKGGRSRLRDGNEVPLLADSG